MTITNRLIIELRTDIVNRSPKRPLKYISIIIKFDMVSKNQFDSNPEISSNSGKCWPNRYKTTSQCCWSCDWLWQSQSVQCLGWKNRISDIHCKRRRNWMLHKKLFPGFYSFYQKYQKSYHFILIEKRLLSIKTNPWPHTLILTHLKFHRCFSSGNYESKLYDS